MCRFPPFAALFLALPASFARTFSGRSLIRRPVDSRVVVAVPNSAPAIAQSRFELGAAPADTVLPEMRLVLAQAPQQEADLKSYIAGEMNPASPDYHKWLTPTETCRSAPPESA